MRTIERSKVGVSQILKRHLEYFSSYKHFSKLKPRAQTEEGMCDIERSNPNVGVGQILKQYL